MSNYKNNLVFLSKSGSLLIRSIFVLLLYKLEYFEFLGLYSIVASLCVIFTGVVGFEMHMISNREIASLEVKNNLEFPLYYHTLMVLLLTILTSFLLFLFIDLEWAAIAILIGTYYVIAEYIRFFNFSKKIVLSANLNLLRDFLVVITFLGYFLGQTTFFFLSLLSLILVFVLLYFSDKLKTMNTEKWLNQTKNLWEYSKYFYLNVITRNILAYADRFLVLNISGLDGLGKYTLLAYVNTSAVTLLNGSVIYTRIPLLLGKKISPDKFIKNTLFKSYLFLILIWLTFYFSYPILRLNLESFSLFFIFIFMLFGSSTLFFGVTGQIVYSLGKDKYLVFTMILAGLITLISSILNSNVYNHLFYTSFALIILGTHRYFVSKNLIKFNFFKNKNSL